MNQDQAEFVFQYICGYWPKDVSPFHERLWIKYLLEKDDQRALKCVEALSTVSEYFPSIAKFDKLYQTYSQQSGQSVPSLEPAQQNRGTEKEKAAQNIAEMKERIKDKTHSCTGKDPYHCEECRREWNLDEPKNKLPICPSCQDENVEYMEAIDSCEYYCVNCNLTYEGNHDEFMAYRIGNGYKRKPLTGPYS